VLNDVETSNGGVENAGVGNAGVDSIGRKCRSGKYRSDNVWKAVKTENSKILTGHNTTPFFCCNTVVFR